MTYALEECPVRKTTAKAALVEVPATCPEGRRQQ